jgi:hypothetical protein
MINTGRALMGENTIDHTLMILQAIKDGKPVERKFGDEWKDCTEDVIQAGFLNPYFKYRLKKEPHVFYMNEWRQSGFSASMVHPNKASAENAAKGRFDVARIAVKFQEVEE